REIRWLAFENGFGRSLWIDIQSADGAERMFSGGNGRRCISVIRIGIHPALSLIFQVVGGLLSNVATVVTFDHAQREIDPGRKSAGSGEVAVLNKARAAFELDVRKRHGETPERAVIRGRGFALEQTGLRQNKRAGTDRHRDIGRL